MVFSIGIISAKSSLSHIQSSLSSRDSATYQFHYFPYSSVDEVPQIYKEHEHDCDGFVFSGALPYYQLLRHYSKLRVPCTYIDVTQRDYYRTLLQVTYQNPHLDIRRIWLDRPAVDIPWEYIFGTPDARPQMLPEVSIESLFQPGIYQDIFQQYRDIIQNHQADFIITRVTNLNEQLKAANIPFALLLPSPSGIWETVEKLIHLIQSQQMADNLSAVGLVRVADGTDARQVPDFQEWIAQFNRELGGGLILRNYANSTEILTSNSTLHRLTRNGSRFQLTDYLRQNCTTSFSLGWGVGLNVLQAQQNANRAINESLRDPNHGTYLIDENDRLTGPLGAEGCRTFSTQSSQEAQLLAQRAGLSLTNAERLLEVSRNQLNLRVTRNDLSLYLNTTPRTANRILNRLTELGAAVAAGTEQGNSAGRPISTYRLELQKLLAPET